MAVFLSAKYSYQTLITLLCLFSIATSKELAEYYGHY